MINSEITNKPNIFYITASYPYGPGESFIGPEIAEWKRRGYKVTVIPIYPRGSLRDSNLEWSELTHYALFKPKYLLSFVKLFFLSPRNALSLFGDILLSPTKLLKNLIAVLKAFAVADMISTETSAHIHAHWGGTSSTMAMGISKLTGIPWSLTCHRWDIYENNLLAIKSRSAIFVRFISERGRNDAISLGVPRDKTEVIHMGVESVSSIPFKNMVSKHVKIICAANLLEVKGHKYLIEAIKFLKDDSISVTLYLYGSGPLLNVLQKQCDVLGISSEVVFLEHRPHAELLSAYEKRDVDLFVLPSVDLGHGLHEGIPVSLMEAMSFGIPVISTRTGSIDELLPHDLGLTVPERDSHALANSIKSLIIDPVRYSDVSKKVIEIISSGWLTKVSVDEIESKILKYYK